MVEGVQINVGFLSGSIKGKKRKELFKLLKDGDIDILIGTHAIIEDPVVFKNLGLAINDEQHRFGVMQRSRLWRNNPTRPPHILVMTANPIPRTLAMTVYGDLDVSVIDELPPGRKPVKTLHHSEARRPEVLAFMHKEIKKAGRYMLYFL
jgi:ATP-dependent DNA helicase RecG